METSFYISADALHHLQPDAQTDEAGFLNTFDRNRDLICAAAAKIFKRGGKGSYDLAASDF